MSTPRTRSAPMHVMFSDAVQPSGSTKPITGSSIFCWYTALAGRAVYQQNIKLPVIGTRLWQVELQESRARILKQSIPAQVGGPAVRTRSEVRDHGNSTPGL